LELIILFLTEQEITGDVLLELDVNLLKTEIGIAAFGKRVRIANAISELRRPPSISYSDHPASPHSLMHGHSNPHSISPNTASPSPGHSRNHSQIHPQMYTYPHGRSQSIQSSAQLSLNGPLTPGSAGLFIVSPESPPGAGDIPGSPSFLHLHDQNGEREDAAGGENATVSEVNGSFTDSVERAVAGLGIGLIGDRMPSEVRLCSHLPFLTYGPPMSLSRIGSAIAINDIAK
jgi:SAM domain (Sterile alpha motif)